MIFWSRTNFSNTSFNLWVTLVLFFSKNCPADSAIYVMWFYRWFKSVSNFILATLLYLCVIHSNVWWLWYFLNTSNFGLIFISLGQGVKVFLFSFIVQREFNIMLFGEICYREKSILCVMFLRFVFSICSCALISGLVSVLSYFLRYNCSTVF